MKVLLLVIQSILSLSLALVILIQAKGTGLGRAWGGTGTSFSRRGLEKVVFRATFVLSALFILISIISVAL